jgi:archaetidylinositol phosphate synthase
MLDSYCRAPYQRLIDPLAKRLQCTPNLVTLLALITGLLTAPLLYFHQNIMALIFLALSGFLDTLDGSIARLQKKSSPLGSAFDIFADRCVEISVICGFALRNSATAPIVIAMLASTLLCITSFLVVGIFSENDSSKSFHYSPGLMERGEAFLFFGLQIIFPSQVIVLGGIFSLLVVSTGIKRILVFRNCQHGKSVS